ncbi:MAG: Fic family protein [Legionellales bacterium]|jgi:fido (protein-threonine AMPylation protein)
MSKLIFAGVTQSAKSLSKRLLKGELRRIHQGIYTEDLETPLTQIVQKDWMSIIPYIVSNGILSFRTAFDLKPVENIVLMTSSYTKTIPLPGLTIKVQKGDYQHFIEPVSFNLSRSNETRMLLENLSVVRAKTMKLIKVVGQQGVEHYLSKVLRVRGEAHLNRIRDDAKQIAMLLSLESEYKTLNQIISALLSTHSDDFLKTPYAKAMAKKVPYDATRIQLFESLALYLKRCIFMKRAYLYDKKSFNNLSFFESYFSNYIEGTRFTIDEAENIVFNKTEIKHRHADSHDVLALYYLTNDYLQISVTPRSIGEFLELLQSRHSLLMQERLDKRPGEFKNHVNMAGNTTFVLPSEVIGTLTVGFDIYTRMQSGLEKALFMHFLISEVHPFEDGNGRIARIMMNAELVQDNSYKIIIPTVHRDNYLYALKRASRDHNFQIYCKVLDQAQAYSASIPWFDYADAREKLVHDHADKSPDEGLPIFNRALRELSLSECALLQ